MRRILVTAALLLAVGALGACSSSGGSGKSAGTVQLKAGRAAGDVGGAPGGAGLPAQASSAGSGLAAGAVTADQRSDVGAAAAGGTPARGAASGVPVVDDGSAKIRTARMTVAVRRHQDVPQQADAADAIALRAGGEIDSDDRTTGTGATASLALRVPPEQLQPVLTALGKLGTERSRSSSTTDVTEQVADVTSRLASSRESIARLRELYTGAHKVADVIAVESELSSREADLESLEAQQRSLAKQTAMASVSLNLETASTHAPPPKKRPSTAGFVGGLRRGWDGFVAAASWVAAAVGTLLPFLFVLFVLALAARLLGLRVPMRGLGRRGGGGAPPAPVPSE